MIVIVVVLRLIAFRFQRGLKRKPMALIKKLRKAVSFLFFYLNELVVQLV